MLCSAVEEACPVQLSGRGAGEARRHQGSGHSTHRNTTVAICKLKIVYIYTYHKTFIKFPN